MSTTTVQHHVDVEHVRHSWRARCTCGWHGCIRTGPLAWPTADDDSRAHAGT